MDGHALLGDIASYSCILGDGGPRSFRRRGSPLPEKYLPGRFLSDLRSEIRTAVTRAANARTSPASWFLRLVVMDEAPRAELPPLPVDQRWSRRGRWSTPC